uniref:sugar ABC transporter substrate-binding protein n=1 Tax=Candidatus Fimenecus sp. TaxID=3022888 RepID=UPI004029EADC
MKKKILSLLLVVALIATACLALAACNDNNDDDKNKPGGELKGSVKIWWPGGSPTIEAAINKAKTEYEAAHEGVTIDIATQSTADFYSSYTMALMNKDNFPDIAYVDHVFVQRLAYDGLIGNLSDYGADEVKDKFIDSLWSTTQFNGGTYALPMSANVLTVAYNKALLTKVLGKEFTDADMPKNWDEYIAIGKKIEEYNTANNLTGNNKLYLTTVPAGTGNESMGAMFFMSYAARSGGRLMNDNLTAMELATEQNKSAAAKIKQLGDLGYTPTSFSESKFETGKVAFIEMGPWKLIDYSRISASQKDICDIRYTNVFPLSSGGQTQGALGLYSLVMTKKTKNAALAADFIKYLTTSDEIQLAHNTVQNLMPTTKTAIANEYYQTAEWSVFINQLNNIVARPGSAAWPAIQRSLAEYVTQLVTGDKNGVPDQLDAIEIQLNEALEDLEDE